MKLERILVPVDFSRHSDRSARMALGLARRSGAAITLLHVDPLPSTGIVAVEPMYVPPDLWEGIHRQQLERIDADLKQLQADLQSLVAEPVAIDLVTRRGRATDGILEYASESNADLIVMGSHGGGAAARFLLGSTTEKVARIASCPVLVMRPRSPEDEESEARVPELHRAVAGIDYSEFSMPVARAAAALVRPGGVVELAHVFPLFYLSALDAQSGGGRDEIVDAMERGRLAQVGVLEQWATQADLPGVETTLYVGSGRAPEALIDRASETGADVIVVGAHAQEGISQRILGTVADRVLRHADGPVLMVPAASLART